MDTLTVEYGVKEGRSAHSSHALTIFLTIVVCLLMISAVAIVLFWKQSSGTISPRRLHDPILEDSAVACLLGVRPSGFRDHVLFRT
jgi:hypothetical protein